MAYLSPTRYFVVSGSGLSRISKLNAFDEALRDAGIHNYNLVPVSSIIPLNAFRIDPVRLNPGSIVFVVMARKYGVGGEKIKAGVAWAMGIDSEGRRYGCVVESNSSERSLEAELKLKLDALCASRGFSKVVDRGIEIKTLEVPDGYYGCVVAAVVLI